MILFDTDVLVGWLRGDEAARRAIRAAGPEGYTTSVNAAELLEGAALSQRPEDERIRVLGFLSQLRQIPFGPRAARVFGPLSADLWRRGEHPGLVDVLVASVALAEEAEMVTRNRKHFGRVKGLKLHAW